MTGLSGIFLPYEIEEEALNMIIGYDIIKQCIAIDSVNGDHLGWVSAPAFMRNRVRNMHRIIRIPMLGYDDGQFWTLIWLATAKDGKGSVGLVADWLLSGLLRTIADGALTVEILNHIGAHLRKINRRNALCYTDDGKPMIVRKW